MELTARERRVALRHRDDVHGLWETEKGGIRYPSKELHDLVRSLHFASSNYPVVFVLDDDRSSLIAIINFLNHLIRKL